MEKFNDNLAAIRALKAIESDRRRATPDEQRLLARYVGWGGLANAFPDPITGEFKDKWKARGEELRELLTPSEYAQARRSTRNAHYTSEAVVSAMWTMARRLGFRGGLVLESSMGAGNFLGLAPQDVPATFIGVEYDGLTARIAGALYPQAAVLHTGFQKVPMADNAFALNIGNPPFGKESLRFQYKPELAGASIHNQFFRAGIDAVRPGGLQINVVSRFLMDAQDTASRAALARKARLVAAIRLPDTAFKENARTEVVTDIIILQKLTPAEQARMDQIVDAFLRQPEKKAEDERERRKLADQIPDWVRTTNVRDPLGNGAMRVNSYFAENPDQVMGVMERSGSMQPSRGDDEGPDITVRLDNPAELERMLAQAIERLPKGISQIADEVLAATEERFGMLAEALRISVAQEQPGHLKIDPDRKLLRVIERESPDGGEFMARQTITPGSPWSEQLLMDDKGRWYKMEAVLGEDGKPVKAVKDGKATKRNVYERVVYEREEDVPEGLRLGQTGYAKLMGLVNMRDLLKQQLVLETEDAPTAQMEGNRKKLAEAYEKFTAEHGPVNRPANLRLAMTMPDGGLLAALEDSYQPERTAEQAKKSGLPAQSESAPSAAILRTRVVPKYEPPTSAKTAADALSITLAERGRVDMERIAELRGVTPEAAAAELQAGEKPLVFMDPESQQWETADEYLTGLVKRKLNAAQAAGMDLNVKALEAVQPEPWTAENVNVQMGATWVPPDVYARFAEHLLGGKARVTFSPLTNAFSVDVQGSDRTKAENWSTTGAPATYIIQRILNSQAVKVTYEDADGNTRVDEEATALAILKSKEIVAEFGDWVFKDGEQRRMLVDLFNEKFNTRVSRQYDGQHLTLPGKVPDAIIALRRHQKNAVWRGISSRFLLLDHVVGAGKTFTGIARAMERRRMGIARKPVIVVPNHLVEQWAIDVYRLYPGAKVLAAGQNDFEAKRRRKLFSKIATGDWDIVIVPHSSFGFIGISPDTEQRFLEAEMREANAAIEQALEQAKEDGTDNGRRKPFGVKEAERLAEKIQARLDKLAEGARDRLLTFEQLGIDDLTVDEAHEFKNLFYSSRLSGVRGMGNKTGSRKAADLYNKVRVLRESGGAVTFMTGTPVSNSAVELYTMMRYLAADALEEQGLTHFDAWRSQYVDATPAFEPTETGRLKEVTRMGRSWSNMRSLMDLYYQFTDAVTIDDIKKWYRDDNAGADFPVPKVKGGERQLVKLKPTADQERVLQEVIEGFDSLPNEPDPFERNKMRLRLMDRARKVSLDVRAVDPRTNATEKGGKLEVIATEVKRIYDKWTPERGTQLVFLDRSVPKAKGDDKIIKEYDALVAKREKATIEGDEAAFSEASDALEKFDTNEIDELRNAQAGGWNAYQQLKDNLVAAGVPANEIRFIQEASNDEQKQALFDAVNGGKVRVLIGSTQRMGAGTNVQKRIVALHHADVTWKPSDIEQREGRAIRQGNLLATPPTKDRPNDLYRPDFELEILAYATERTVDAKMWDLNATKLRTINGLRKYDGAFTMDIEDEESVSMAEMAALASGNPLLLERVTLESQIANMELQERAHRRKTVGAADSADSARRTIEEAPRRIAQMRERAANLAPRVEAMRTAAAARKVVVEGQEFTSLMEANRAAQAAMELQQEGNTNARYAVTIDGQRATSKDAIAEALGAALGDALPFEVTIGKKTYTQRTPAGRDAAAEINKATPRVTAEGQQEVELGTMFGFRLVADLTPSRWSNKNEVQLDLTLMDGEKTLVSENFGSVDPGLAIPTSKMRDALGAMAQRVEAAAADDATQWLEDSITRAKRDLPGFEQRAAEPFAKADELKAKRERLKEVVAELSDKGKPAKAPDGIEEKTDDEPGDIRLSVDSQAAKPDTSRYEYDGDRNHQNTVRFAVEAIAGDGGDYVLEAVKPPRSRLDLLAAGAVARDVGGHEVIFVRQPNGRRINGAAFRSGRDYLLIDVDSTRPVMAVVGHEMLHRLRAQRPELYERLLERLKGVLTGESEYADDLRAKYERAGVDLISDPDAIREELVADLFGDEWNDPAFWRELGQGQPSGWRAVVDAIAKILDEIVAAVSAKRPFGTQKYISDLRAAREAVIEATREFGAGRVGAMADKTGLRLSVDPDAGTPANKRTIQQQVREELPNLFRDALAGTAKSAGAKVTWWDRTIGTQYAKAQKFPGFKAVFDRAHRYLEDTSSMANEAADKARDILPKLETWKDIGKAPLSTKDAQAIAAPIFTGTLTDQKVYDDAELRDRFGLSERQIGLYRDFLEAVNTSLDQVVAADVVRLLKIEDAGMQNLAVDHRAAFRARVEAMLEDRIENGDPEAQGLLDMVRDKYMRVATLKEEGYAPLMRFGRYKVHVLDKQGQTLFFSLHESAREANERARELGEDPAYKGARFERGVLSEEQYKLFNQVPIDSLEMFAEAVGAEKSAIFQEFIKLAKNNRSALKRLIHRKGTAGFAEDVPRVLAAFVTSNARLASGAMNLPAAKEAAESIREGDVKDEAIKLVDAIENPREVAGAARGLMFMNFIGGSIASALVNITQPVTMTLPYLSQWGGGVKAAGRLMEAGRIAARGTGGSVDLRAALMRAEREGIVSPQEIHHLTAQAMSTWGKHPALQKLAFVWGAPFSLAEQFNRRVSFIAAYQTAKDEGIENPFAFAEKSVIETQGLYSKANAPNWARNPVGAVALTFKQFSIHYMEWMGRMYRSGPEGKKAVLLALALLVLAAGVDGLPFAADIDDLVDTIGQAAGYDMNAKRWRRELLADAFGDEWADVIARGGSAAAGVPFDISLRMSMGNMVPGSGLLLRSSTDRTNDVLEIAGPAGGLAKQYLESGRKALAGDFAQAALGLAPVAIQNLGKAAQMWSTGEARDALGRKIMDTDEVDAAARFLGFNPSVVARESEKLGMIRRSEQLAKNVEGEIAGRWARALADGDSEGVAEARAELAEWNEANPQQRIVITQRQLRSRVKALRLERAQRFITSASPERRQQVREALEDGR